MKNFKIWTVLLIGGLLSAGLMTGCGNQASTANPAPVTSVEQPTPAATPVADKKPTDPPQKVEQPDSKKYYVDPKNFLIRPVDTNDKEKIVLLTFDDGPSGDTTLQILNTLDQYHAKAVWFISGFNYGPEYRPDPNKTAKFEERVREIHKRGHLVASHTWTHQNLTALSPDLQRKEVTAMNELLEKITGEKINYIRPPFGSYTDAMQEEARKQQMQWMNWSVGSLDWELKDPQKVVQQTVSTVYNGANILMHDNSIEAKALPEILKQLKEQGYQFVLPTEIKSE